MVKILYSENIKCEREKENVACLIMPGVFPENQNV